jgi:hypothetical protein
MIVCRAFFQASPCFSDYVTTPAYVELCCGLFHASLGYDGTTYVACKNVDLWASKIVFHFLISGYAFAGGPVKSEKELWCMYSVGSY